MGALLAVVATWLPLLSGLPPRAPPVARRLRPVPRRVPPASTFRRPRDFAADIAFECESCHHKVGPLDGDTDDLEDKVMRFVEQKLRAGTWTGTKKGQEG